MTGVTSAEVLIFLGEGRSQDTPASADRAALRAICKALRPGTCRASTVYADFGDRPIIGRSN
jgi:hypothetical protein